MSPLFYITDNAVRSTVRPAFPIRKKTAFPPSTRYDSHKPLQYPSRLLFRASLRKPKNPVDSSPRFSSPKKNGFPAVNRHGGKPVAIPVPTSLPRLSPQAEKSGRQFAPLFLSEKKRLSCNQPARQQTRCNTRPDFSSAPLSASRKIRSTVRPAFPLRKKTVFLQSTGTAANPLQYPSRLLLRASPRKPKNPVDSSSRFSSPKKNGFPAINRHGGKPVAIPVPTSPPCLSPQAEKSG